MSYCDGDEPGEVRSVDLRAFWFHSFGALFILALLVLTTRAAF